MSAAKKHVATARPAPHRAPKQSVDDTTTDAIYTALRANSGATASAVARAAAVDKTLAAKALTRLEAEGRATRTPGATRTAPATWTAVTVNRSGTVRLSKGQLADQAVEFLRERPGLSFTPGEIGRKLGGRSSGAVLNALVKRVPGDVVQTSDKPIRFSAAPTASAAARPHSEGRTARRSRAAARTRRAR